jgi:hypothetical protein
MINQDFCDYLEYELTKAFRHSDDEKVKGFWCDGVVLPSNEQDYSPKAVNDRRQIVTTAYIGKTGQDPYELTIQFGNQALSRYARGLDIISCVPDPQYPAWMDIDVAKQRLSIQLD